MVPVPAIVLDLCIEGSTVLSAHGGPSLTILCENHTPPGLWVGEGSYMSDTHSATKLKPCAPRVYRPGHAMQLCCSGTFHGAWTEPVPEMLLLWPELEACVNVPGLDLFFVLFETRSCIAHAGLQLIT